MFIFKSKRLALDALERAVKTVAEVAVTLIGIDQFTHVLDVNWADIGGISFTAGIVSLLVSVSSAKKGDPTSASLSTTVDES